MSAAVEKETGGCWSALVNHIPIPSTLSSCPALPRSCCCVHSFRAGHLKINRQETSGVQRHGDTECPFTLRQYRLPKGQTPFPSPAPPCCGTAPSKWSVLAWEDEGEGRQQLPPHRPLELTQLQRRWRGGKQPHQSRSNHLSFPFKNVTAAPSAFYNNVYHCSSIVWDNKWLEMSIYHQEISACPFPQAVS